MLIQFLLLAIGLVILYYGAEWLVEGSSKIALGFGISPMIIGLTVVAAGTSAPEFIVSLLAAVRGSADIALGNVVGSNIANIALIVGSCAVLLPMPVERSVLSRDFPFLITSVVVMLAVAYVGGRVGRLDGVLLVAVGIAFLGTCLRVAHRQSRHFKATGQLDALDPEHRRVGKHALRVVLGIVGLVVGARLMVDSAVAIARNYEISEFVIGVTVVALGTSLPELATSVTAAIRKEQDISLGNIIGSNIFNTGFILGSVATIHPVSVAPAARVIDLPAMAIISLLLFPFLRISYRVTRLDGALLLSMYVAYVALSVLYSTGRLNWFA